MRVASRLSFSTRRWPALWMALLLVLSLFVSACASGGTSESSAHAPHATATAPFIPIAPGWRLYTDHRYGFAIQYPPGAILIATAPTGSFAYAGWRLTSAAEDIPGSATLLITVTPQPGASLCAVMAHGAPVTVGGNIPARQFDNLTTPTPSGVSQPLQLSAMFTSGGLFTIITLSGSPPASAFLQRWETVWRDTLASYRSGHGPVASHPCA